MYQHLLTGLCPGTHCPRGSASRANNLKVTHQKFVCSFAEGTRRTSAISTWQVSPLTLPSPFEARRDGNRGRNSRLGTVRACFRSTGNLVPTVALADASDSVNLRRAIARFLFSGSVLSRQSLGDKAIQGVESAVAGAPLRLDKALRRRSRSLSRG